EVLRLQPNLAEGFNQLGVIQGRRGRLKEAIDSYRRAVEIQPGTVRYRSNLAYALQKNGQTGEARAEYNEALALSKTWPQAAGQAAWTLSTHPDSNRRDALAALELAEPACQATDYQESRLLEVLAAVLAEAGRFEEAANMAQRAMELLPAGER